jgi:hypothetical protein
MNAMIATTIHIAALALPPGINRGESVLGYIYAPYTEAIFPEGRIGSAPVNSYEPYS